MSQYSIKDLEKLSGVKAHTIRIWEKRYSLLEPHRTSTNIRYYDDEHLKRILNVSLLVNNGHKISRVSSWTSDQINETLTGIFEKSKETSAPSIEVKLNGLIVAMMELDEPNFNHIFAASQKEYGLLDTVRHLIYPLLEKIGIMWGINEINPAQEHFISNLIRQKLVVAINDLKIPKKPKKKFVLFLPETELHELGLLIAHYILRNHECGAIYLGANVPFEDIAKINLISKPDFLLTYFTKSDTTENIQKVVDRYHVNFPDKTILIGGADYLFEEIVFPKNIHRIDSVESLMSFVTK